MEILLGYQQIGKRQLFVTVNLLQLSPAGYPTLPCPARDRKTRTSLLPRIDYSLSIHTRQLLLQTVKFSLS